MTFIREHCVDVWLYKDAYVKFGTNVFSLDSLHQSIHITNYNIQKNFMNSLDAVENSKENMWTLEELLSYFEAIGHGLTWSRQIYPGIKRNILAVVHQSLETTELEANNFELNGADFMIGFDFQPILIEINSKPALFFSRTVVEIITKKLLEDVVKVTVDWQRNPISATGDFELIHCIEIPKVESTKVDLTVRGTKLERFALKTSKINSQTKIRGKSLREERKRASSYSPKSIRKATISR